MWQLFAQVLSWLEYWLKGDSQLFLFWNKLKSTMNNHPQDGTQVQSGRQFSQQLLLFYVES